MDPSKSLLDFLNGASNKSSPARNMTDDRDRLKSPSGSMRADSANDLLNQFFSPSASKIPAISRSDRTIPSVISASFQPSQGVETYTQQPDDTRVAKGTAGNQNLLSTLLGKANPQLPVQPRPESTGEAPETQTNIKPFFHHVNPFDELAALAGSTTTNRQTGTLTNAKPPSAAASSESASKTKILQRGAGSDKQDDKSTDSKTIDLAPMFPATPMQPNGRRIYKLPSKPEHAISVPEDVQASRDLTNSQDITKMKVKQDAMNRNIIAASIRYFAYALPREDDQGAIRVMDFDDGSTCVLSGHSSKVINLSFSHPGSEEQNALMSADVEGQVIIWSVDRRSLQAGKLHKTFNLETAGGLNLKSRTRWSPDGSFFAISITSRIYIFPYIASKYTVEVSRKSLEGQTIAAPFRAVCATDKSAKEFCFSSDGTVIATVDKNGTVKLFDMPLADSMEDRSKFGETLSPKLIIATGEQALFAVEFVGKSRPQRHLVLGTQQNQCMMLCDLETGKVCSELSLPFPENKGCSLTSRLLYDDNYDILMVSSELRQSIFLVSMDLPPTTTKKGTSQADFMASVDRSNNTRSSGLFTSFEERSMPKDKFLLNFTVAKGEQGLDLIAAHDKGYTVFGLDEEELCGPQKIATLIPDCVVTALSSKGSFVDGATKKITSSGPTAAITTSSSLADPKASTSPPRKDPPKAKKEKKRDNAESPERLKTTTSSKMPASDTTAEIYEGSDIGSIAQRLEHNIQTGIRKEFASELKICTQQFAADVRTLQTANNARHETILRLISETLTTNTTKVLRSAVKETIEQSVIPALSDIAETTLKSQLEKTIGVSLDRQLASLLPSVVSEAIGKALSSTGMVQQLAGAVSYPVLQAVKADLAHISSSLSQELQGDLSKRLANLELLNERLVKSNIQIVDLQGREFQRNEKLQQTVDRLQILVDEHATSAVSHQDARTPVGHQRNPSQVPKTNRTASMPAHTVAVPPSGPIPVEYTSPANGHGPQRPVDVSAEYKLDVVRFIQMAQQAQQGDPTAVQYTQQFLDLYTRWEEKQSLVTAIANDQLTLLSFVYALSSDVEDHITSRVEWLHFGMLRLAPETDERLRQIAPQILNMVHANLRNCSMISQPIVQGILNAAEQKLQMLHP